MYRILSASKDTYITNKIIVGSASLDANVGQAGTLDLFKLYNETPSVSGNINELSRLLIAFDYSPLQSLTSSFLNTNTGSFRVLFNLKDIYGGQTIPSNFTVSLFPLAKAFDEGRGMDVKAFRDVDTANWMTASVLAGVGTAWSLSGCMASGNLGASNIDYYLSGNLGLGSQSLEITQNFLRGDEDLSMDITRLVSASMAGILPNNGFRLSFSSTEETDTVTRFVKRFGSRHTLDITLHPSLNVKYDDHLADDNNVLFFDNSNNVFFYNRVGSTYTNFMSASSPVTGSNNLLLTLVVSKSIVISTSSFQQNFSASITYNTSSQVFYSTSVTASQATIGGIFQPGIYTAPLLLNLQTDANLSNFLGGNSSLTFASYWQSLDQTVMFATGSWLTVKKAQGDDSNVLEHNWVTNVTNLKSLYANAEVARLRVFVQDYNLEQTAFKLPVPTRSAINKSMYWRLVNAFDRSIIIPFDDVGTLMSYDGQGMYFDLYMQDLPVNRVYELEFKVVENGKSYLITNQGFRFKVVP